MTAVADTRGRPGGRPVGGKPGGRPGPRPVAAPARPKGKRFDVKALPGFAVMAWFCVVALYTPIAVLVAFLFRSKLPSCARPQVAVG